MRFSLDALNDARSKLSNLHLFSSVEVDYHADPAHPELADVLTVSGGAFRAWRLGAGLSFDFQRMEVRGRVSTSAPLFLTGCARCGCGSSRPT